MELSRDKIKEIINDDWLLMDDCEGNKNCDVVKELARIALASLEAEPVGTFRNGPCGYSPSFHEDAVPLYTAPPAPVSVPDAYIRDERGRMMLNGRQEPRIGYSAGWNAYRAAMLQGAEPVTKACKLPDDFDFDRFNDVVWLETVASNPHMHSPTTSTIAMVALELNRKLAAGNSPVIPDGWVNCIERMPKKGERDIWLFDGEFVHHGYIWDGHDFVDWNEEYESITGITHWMKMALPAAPQKEV
ncbi:DUF551 domain-containing protein [Enterobacter ludwigii]|uniref:DUF551 domain-containing protein n=1 Tax=Enterobacter ludwigii TaxID=299767 RepID=UPI001BA573B2|nr:DUF551 domain-containing protein [Enterobacter ludwigii]MBS0870710.1 DUF551 domain-containing protein [Enterobacter ludwigii]